MTMSQEITLYYVGSNPGEALAGLPWDNYKDADQSRRDNDRHPDQVGSEPTDEIWKVYSVIARIDESTIQRVPESE